MTLMKDLIHIPEKVQRGDFVLNLSTGLAEAAIAQTLGEYVVTPQLAKSFDDALSFIKSTVASNQNRQKGAYLHGSFGSGKSHFMAVLHLLLQGNMQARAINELAPAISKNDDWLQSKNILLVPYHMIGAQSIESGILGGYAKYIKKLHPHSPVPGFYMSDRLFQDAVRQRSLIGDEAFFKALNSRLSGQSDDSGWGEIAEGWDAISFESVISGQSSDNEKVRLVGDLVGTFFSAFADMANTHEGGYVEFDEGLRIMTQHAKDLGYDAVILFLDELILWLASRLSDQQFISTEIQKVVKLVESSEPRALPMASFIARQRDLREFVGDQYTGAEQQVLSDSLKYWDGRFHTITLEDRNLPVIAEKRLLKPLNEQARQLIAEAFTKTEKMREESFNILLTNQGDREMFRALYPFSPALVQALVALSSALQRERTALKVMLMLLVDQREILELGNVIPVGDLYDVIGSEAEPFSDIMRMHFDNAKTLFERKLIPMLESEHNVSYVALSELSETNPSKLAFKNDMRLLKTLLLSALVPEVECFKQLTANKLVALNHGTIRTPIPGQEARTVLTKCRKWAGQVGEIKITDENNQTNPIITIQLSGVDTESILEQAKIHDTDGARRKLVKDMVFEAFGVKDDNQLFLQHEFIWKGTRRTVEVLFQNIREISDTSTFEARGDDWKIIIDFPFDKDNHSPSDDKARIQDYEAGGGQTRTICWLPYFLSQAAKNDLGTLAKLQYILKNDDRFNSFSKHLSPVDRGQARTLLDNQRSQLQQRVKDYLMGAYGASEAIAGSLDDSVVLETQVMSLDPAFTPRLPYGSTLGKAFEQLLGQALEFQYPDHPDFEVEVKLADLGRVFTELRKAIHATNGRIEIDSPMRPLMRQLAQPLKLGDMHERHFLFKQDWPQQLKRIVAQESADNASNDTITVQELRRAMDKPKPKGLTEAIQNLLIMVFAEHGQYAYTRHGGDYDVTLKDIPDNLVLIKQDLAEPSVWKMGVENAAAIFGIAVSLLRTANNQNDLQKQVLSTVQHYLDSCKRLSSDLSDRLSKLNMSSQCHRLNNTHLAVQCLTQLHGTQGAALVAVLAAIKPVTSLQALAKSMKTAASVSQSLEENNWQLLESVWNAGTPEGQRIKRNVCEALAADELVTSIAPALKQAQADATAIITKPTLPVQTQPPAATPTSTAGKTIVKQGQKTGLTASAAKLMLKEIESALVDGVIVDVSYTITRQGDR